MVSWTFEGVNDVGGVALEVVAVVSWTVDGVNGVGDLALEVAAVVSWTVDGVNGDGGSVWNCTRRAECSGDCLRFNSGLVCAIPGSGLT